MNVEKGRNKQHNGVVGLTERGLRIISLRDNGKLKWSAIAKEIGLSSGTTVKHLYIGSKARIWDYENRDQLPLYGLPDWVSNILAHRFPTRDDIMKAVADGTLSDRYGGPGHCKIRNYGKLAHNEVLKWLGLKTNPTGRVIMECPHCRGRFSMTKDRSLIKEL